jgi:hypothetical protein
MGWRSLGEERCDLLASVTFRCLRCAAVTRGASCALLCWCLFGRPSLRVSLLHWQQGRRGFGYLLLWFGLCCGTVIIALTFDALGRFAGLRSWTAWNRQWRIIFGTFHAVRGGTSLIDVVLDLDVAILGGRVVHVMLRFLDGLLFRFRLCGLLLGAEEVGNVVLVCGTVDGNEERRRVVANLAYIFADLIALKFPLVRLQECLQVLTPLCTIWIKPSSYRIRSVIQDDGHAVVQKVELFVGVGGDDGVGIELLARV